MTLLELLVTLSVVTILATVAAPSVSQMMENNRLTAINNQIVSALTYARSEAVKRVFPVNMCAREADGTCATAATAAAGTGFEDGWVIFVDCNRDNIIDSATNVCDFNGDGTNESPEPVLTEEIPSTKSNMTVTSTSTLLGRAILYLPNGKVSPASLEAEDNEYDLDINIDNVARNRIKVMPLTGRVKSCKVGTTGC